MSGVIHTSTMTTLVGVQPSVFGELKHYFVSKVNHQNSSCRVCLMKEVETPNKPNFRAVLEGQQTLNYSSFINSS